MQKRYSLNSEQDGVLMPLILGFFVIFSSIGLTLALVSVQTYNQSVRFAHTQIAHIAAKAAIDCAEEQYELNAAYNGTPETDLISNQRYRATLEVEVLYDQGASAKRVRAYGRVYVPETSTDASDFTREIQSSIIRNGEVSGGGTGGDGASGGTGYGCSGVTDDTSGDGSTVTPANPADYEPVMWLDSSEPNSLFSSATTPNTLSIVSLPGNSNGDVAEQRGADANSNKGKLEFNSSDLEFAYDGTSRGTQSVGIRFRNVTVPQGETIDNAYVQFKTDSTHQSGSVQLNVRGVATDNVSTWSGNYAVDNAIKTTATTLWEPPNWNDVGASGANERVDVTSIVQEIVDRSGWNSGNALAITVQWIQGSGVRTAENSPGQGAATLHIQYGNSSDPELASNDGDNVGTWLDKSGNNNHAELWNGSDASYETAEINSLPVVRFDGNQIFKSDLTANMSGNALTAFMVMKPKTTSDSSARFLTAMNSSNNEDSGSANPIIPFFKYSSTSTLYQYYNSTWGEYISSAIDGNWGIYTSRISQNYSERLLKNGTDNYSDEITTVNYNVNEIFIGGRRTGSSNTATQFADMDVAEIIVYDQDMVCSEIQAIEDHLSDKYGVTVTEKDCP